ncbi:MAG: DUF3990 domain-containing protein [Defluviitaleaceae bacterium]|nr:DUF3990 domain-containing protein [Defluviitaleaceae bacterium]
MNLTVYHGSNRKLLPKDVIFPGLREDCDFGRGFYVTDKKEIAEEWVCSDENPVINVYNYTIFDENVLYLNGTDWLRVIVGFRSKKFDVKFNSSIIHGSIANDRLFDSLRDFTRGIIGDLRLIECSQFCKLGSQYCLRKNADGLDFVESYDLSKCDAQKSRKRIAERRNNMKQGLLQIYRSNPQGELYIEDYYKKGDFYEV